MASAAFNSGDKAPPPDPQLVQVRLMRFADLFALEITRATEEFAELGTGAEARIQALTWRLEYTNALWRRASGPQPYAGLFDSIVLITALRAAHEERWRAQWGEANQPMIASLTRLEQSIWGLAREGMTKEQVEQVRVIVDTWLAGDPANRIADVARLPGFADIAGSGRGAPSGLMSELTSLVSVDPLSGLEPAVREVEQTRQFAERAFYYVQRMPEILSARFELLVLRSARSSEVAESLASWQRVSQAAASIAATAESLPAALSAEREAALTQLASELTAQRVGLVQDIETAREPVLELLEGTRRTAEAGQAMSASLTETLRALDAFVGRFAGEEDASAAPAPAAAPEAASAEPAGKPFDIAEYGLAAERIGVAARELGATITRLDESLPEVQRLLDAAATRGERSLDHAFARAFQLLAAALAGAAVTTLFVRWYSRRWRGASGRAGAD